MAERKDEMARFVEHAQSKGMDYATIRYLLADRGWKDRQIGEALAKRVLETPVPAPPGEREEREAFLHMFAFVALYVWAFALIALLFTQVNLAYPDPTRLGETPRQDALRSVRWSMASIVVAYPTFLLLWRHLLKAADARRDKGPTLARRRLVYASVLLGAITVLSDLVTLVYYAFEGELSPRFLIKVAILFVVAAGVAVYLALTLRDEIASAT